jgi:Domain of unknown function (DUF1924)
MKAKQADPAFAGFDAERGGALFRSRHPGGDAATPACTSCHGEDPRTPARTPRRVSQSSRWRSQPIQALHQSGRRREVVPAQLQAGPRARMHAGREGRFHHLHDEPIARRRHRCVRSPPPPLCSRPPPPWPLRSPRSSSACRRSPTRRRRRSAGPAIWPISRSSCQPTPGGGSWPTSATIFGEDAAWTMPCARKSSPITWPTPPRRAAPRRCGSSNSAGGAQAPRGDARRRLGQGQVQGQLHGLPCARRTRGL